jgi:hypothetical protein
MAMVQRTKHETSALLTLVKATLAQRERIGKLAVGAPNTVVPGHDARSAVDERFGYLARCGT